MTRLIIEIPDDPVFAPTKMQDAIDENRRVMLLNFLHEKYSTTVGTPYMQIQVMIDDRPDPMDFVKEIFPYGEEGANHKGTVVIFNNGSIMCSCGDFLNNRQVPSLRV